MKRRNFLQALLAGAASITLWPSRSYSVPPQLREIPKTKPRAWRMNPETHLLEVTYEHSPTRDCDWVDTGIKFETCDV